MIFHNPSASVLQECKEHADRLLDGVMASFCLFPQHVSEFYIDRNNV